MAKSLTLAPTRNKIIIGMKLQEDHSKIGLAQEKANINGNLQNHPDRNLPPKEKSGIKIKTGTGTPSKTKTPMSWEMSNPLIRRRSKNRDLQSSKI